GWRPVFLPANNGREPLFIYLIAASMKVLGETLWAIRLPGALLGVLIIPAQYLLVQSLPLPRPRLTALLSATVAALSFWPVIKAHQALRAGLFPLWVTLILWVWWRLLSPTHPLRRPWPWAVGLGLLLAAAAYTHLNARVLPVMLVLSAAWAMLMNVGKRGEASVQAAGFTPQFPPSERDVPRGLGPKRPSLGTDALRVSWLLLALVVACILSWPLILYFLGQPDMLGYRSSQVSVLNPAVNGGDLRGTLLQNAWNLLLMFNVRGSIGWWGNLARRPIFDPLLGLAFLVGVGLLAWDLSGRRGRTAQLAAVVLGLTLGGMMAPSWLSEGAPNYGRLTGIWPVLFLLPAWGLERSAAWLTEWAKGRAFAPRLGLGLMALVMGVSTVWSAWDVAVGYPQSQQGSGAADAGALERGRQVAALVAQGPTYASPSLWNETPVRFVAHDHLPRAFDPRQGLALPAQGDARYVFEPWEAKDAEAFARRWPAARREDVTGTNGSILLVYRLDRAQFPSLPPLAAPVTFGDAIRLQAVKVEPTRVRPGGEVQMTLAWQALAPTDTDLNYFVHLVGQDGRMLGQADGAPLGGSYPTNAWAEGETIIQTIAVRVAQDAPTGPAAVRFGWYDWRTGVRLPAPSHPDDAVEVGQVEVGG
ncbi:MAG: glycosyltransferase family 39 protein, partial [Anaerolineae bacterium]|nr:glycosyltransferase family 39 protein [Anaerolineae bacterium]